HRMEPVLAFADIRVTSEEIYGAGPEPEELCHPGVVVVVLREMTVGAILGRSDAAGGMREVRIERLAAIAFRRESLRLRVDPFAIRILRADHDRARRTDHRHPVLLHRAIDPKHENV